MIYNVKNIYKKYQRNLVINNFNYSFESGLYLLTGINGIGKSTLLKILARVINPSNTNFILDNIKVAYLCEKVELVNSKVSTFLRCICKINNTKFDVKEDLKSWNIEDKNIYNLSKGNKQKVAILLMKYTCADMYIFDEPTDSLDKEAISMFCGLIKEMIEQNKIVIISTHEPTYFSNFSYKEISLCSK